MQIIIRDLDAASLRRASSNFEQVSDKTIFQSELRKEGDKGPCPINSNIYTVKDAIYQKSGNVTVSMQGVEQLVRLLFQTLFSAPRIACIQMLGYLLTDTGLNFKKLFSDPSNFGSTECRDARLVTRHSGS
jgi:hypothetical protein